MCRSRLGGLNSLTLVNAGKLVEWTYHQDITLQYCYKLHETNTHTTQLSWTLQMLEAKGLMLHQNIFYFFAPQIKMVLHFKWQKQHNFYAGAGSNIQCCIKTFKKLLAQDIKAYNYSKNDLFVLQALEAKYTMLRQKLLCDSLRVGMGTDHWEGLAETERQQKLSMLDNQALEQIKMGEHRQRRCRL